MKKVALLSALAFYTLSVLGTIEPTKEVGPYAFGLTDGPMAGNKPALVIKNNNPYIFTGYTNNKTAQINLWDFQDTKNPIETYDLPLADSSDIFPLMYISDNGEKFAVNISLDNNQKEQILFANLTDEARLGNVCHSTQPFRSISTGNGAFSRDGNYMAVPVLQFYHNPHQSINIYDSSGNQKAIFADDLSKVTWSDTDKLITARNNIIKLWDIDLTQPIYDENGSIKTFKVDGDNLSHLTSAQNIIAMQSTLKHKTYKTLIYTLAGKKMIEQSLSNFLITQKLNSNGERLAIIPYTKKDHWMRVLDAQTGIALKSCKINDTAEWTMYGEHPPTSNVEGSIVWSENGSVVTVIFNTGYAATYDLRTKN